MALKTEMLTYPVVAEAFPYPDGATPTARSEVREVQPPQYSVVNAVKPLTLREAMAVQPLQSSPVNAVQPLTLSEVREVH